MTIGAPHSPLQYKLRTRSAGPVVLLFILTQALAFGQPTLRLNIIEPAVKLEECGGLRFAAGMEVTSPESGYIIGSFEYGASPKDCDDHDIGTPRNRDGLQYFVAWKVIDGVVYEGFSEKPHYGRRFSTVSEGSGTQGSLGVLGGLAFLKDFKMDECQWQTGEIPGHRSNWPISCAQFALRAARNSRRSGAREPYCKLTASGLRSVRRWRVGHRSRVAQRFEPVGNSYRCELFVGRGSLAATPFPCPHVPVVLEQVQEVLLDVLVDDEIRPQN